LPLGRFCIWKPPQIPFEEFSMPVLRVGDKSPLAKLFNDMLRSPELNMPSSPGDQFGAKSKEGCKQLQQWLKDRLIEQGKQGFAAGIGVDGIPGNQTWGILCAIAKPTVISPQAIANAVGVKYPVRPATLPPSMSGVQLETAFGDIKFVADPSPDNRERIRITNGWNASHIVSVSLPQTVGMDGAPASGMHAMHKRVQGQMRGLWQAWQNRALLAQVTTFNGLWVPRFQRGSQSVLSNHAWGTAFDVNASSNAYWHLPAFPGENGCLFEHATVAADFGFGWGGNFSRRLDGMHFEVVKVLTVGEAAQALAKYPAVG
jgi:hypothetical protein